MVPRGGALTISKADSKILSFERNISTGIDISNKAKDNETAKILVGWLRGGAKRIDIPRKKMGYGVALFFSVIYLIEILFQGVPECGYHTQGFSVANFNPNLDECLNQNSHIWAWKEDCVFTIIVIALGIKIDAGAKKTSSLAAIIFGHGFLHKWISGKKCYVPPFNGKLNIYANIAYGVFTAFISFFVLHMANVSAAVEITGTIAVPILTVYLSQPKMLGSVSPIFLTTQLLVSFLGVFSDSEAFTQIVGDLFALPCLVSLIELTFYCVDGNKSLFTKWGGHIWYDFFLHISVVATLLPAKTADE